MSLNIYTSNRMENLVSALAGVVARPLASPFIPETIVVQSKGMQRWLAMELAGRFGVWANCDYPFPNEMVWRLFRAMLPGVPDSSPFSPDLLCWKIMGLLPGLLEQPAFTPLRRYLEGERDGLKRYQLAGKIADTLDQYTLFRPELLLEWEAGAEQEGDDAWQALLWRELARYGEGMHRGRLWLEYGRRMRTLSGAAIGLPERLTLFGVSYLPRFHMDVLAATARVREINLFLLSPTREYWADIVSSRVMARLTPQERALRMEGNPLLASLGTLGRDFSDMTIEIADLASVQQDLYHDPGEDTLLAAIQSRILNLTGAGGEEEKRLIGPDDHSVRIHSCHGPLREIEVLRDNLLDLLEREPGLEPRHIVVMTPDIESYAPYVATVFEGGHDQDRRIPYSIADRSLAGEGQVAAVMLKLLALPGSRLGVAQLLDILESPPVSRRFGLDEAELEHARRWLVDTRVRWGLDERDRSRLGLPAYRDNSWRAGLDRLFLGYAMPEEAGALFDGLLPYDDMEGSVAPALGKLADFVDGISQLSEGLNTPRTLTGWAGYFRFMLDGFVATDDETARELDMVAGVLEELAGLEERSGFGEPVQPAVIRAWMTSRLREQQRGLGFMTGGVTFCAMLPMRSIPFKVVALIGMSDGAFPRKSRPPGFDLISRAPRRGDRSLRDEDRYLFLEAILSARRCLYLSYLGQSIRDNSEQPPSVLVSEFLDSVERGFSTPDGRSAKERLVTCHRLQPFSRAYFTPGSPLFSYSRDNWAALREKLDGATLPAPFMATPLDEPPPEWRELTLDTLLSFFRNPARFFVEQRLGVRLEEAEPPLDEREPFSLDHLEAYSLKQELLEITLRGGEPAGLFPVVRARGALPPAGHGELLFADAVKNVKSFAGKVSEEYGAGGALPPLDFQLELAPFRLSGRLDRIMPERMPRYRCAKLKPGDQVRAWLEHLILNALRPEGYPRETVLIMTDGKRRFGAVERADGILKDLLELYWQGLMKPLPFFPRSSMAFANKLEWRLDRAVTAWTGSDYSDGEGEDPYFRLCFGAKPPFDGEFQRVAQVVLEPLLVHLI